MVLINVKVKTLDSRNHEFSVEEDMTVKDFKEHIAEKVEITAELQRLIYCGRVLNDDKPLKEYDVNGKCLHLVQRPPPSSTGSSSSTSDTTSDTRRSRFHTNMSDFENLVMGSFSIPVPVSVPNIVGPPHTTTSLNPSSTLCGNRITVARHMLQCADNIAAYLENPENGLNNQNMDLLSQQTMESTVLEVGISAMTDVDLPQQDVQNIVQAFQGAVSAAFRQNGINNITVQHNDPITMPGAGPSTTTTSSSITIEFPPNIIDSPSQEQNPSAPAEPPQPEITVTSVPQPPVGTNSSANSSAPTPSGRRRQQTTSTQTLAEVIGQMQSVQRRMDPFIQQYYDLLQNDPTFPDNEARDNAQRTFDRVSEALHYMSHAQHAISDLMLDMNLQSPRHLCCRPILVEQSAFVSSGVPQVGVGSINIGPILARASAAYGNNNNNNTSATGNQANQGQNATNTGSSNNPLNISIGNNENLASSIMSAFGFTQNPPQQQNQTPTDTPPSANNNQTSTSTTNTTTSTGSGGTPNPPHHPQDFDDDAGDDTPEFSGGNGNQARNERYRNLIQSLVSSAGQPNAEVHIINANISVAVPPTTTGATTGSNTNSSSSSPSENAENSAETTQARVNSNTLPTTSTQTRSTSRPILTSTTLPPTSIRNLRPLPANILSSFDRFLPCNSHHIRDNSEQQQQQSQQNQQTQTSVYVRPQRRTVSLDRSNMRPTVSATLHIPTPLNRQQSTPHSASSANQSHHFSGVRHQDEELNHSFNLFGIQFSLRDLDSLTPSFFNAQRDALRNFLMQTYFNGHNEVSETSITMAIREILIELNSYLERLSGYQHPDYDVRKSIENLITKSLPFIISLIVEDSSSEFGTRIERHLINFCENVYMILVKCIGVRDTEKYLNDVLNIIMTGGVTQGSLSKFPKYVVQTFLIERRSYDLSEIQEFLIIKRPACEETQDEMMEVDEEASESMNVEDDRNIQAEDLLSDPLPNIERSEPWHAQFPSSWLPIITRDIARQRRQSPQPPYSDAYINGMSSKRRKVLMSKKSSTNVQQMISEDVKSAVQSSSKPAASSSSQGASSTSAPAVEEVVASISNDPAIQNAYREEMKTHLSQRVKSDPDFEAEKHPNTSKYFK